VPFGNVEKGKKRRGRERRREQGEKTENGVRCIYKKRRVELKSARMGVWNNNLGHHNRKALKGKLSERKKNQTHKQFILELGPAARRKRKGENRKAKGTWRAWIKTVQE